MRKIKNRCQQTNLAGFDVEITFKRIKTVRLKIYPPQGEIKISAPIGTNRGLLRHFVNQQSDWIQQQRERLKSVPQLKESQFLTGDIHQIFGTDFFLQVTENSPRNHVEIDDENKKLYLHVVDNSIATKERELDRYYRSLLREKIPQLLEKWQPTVGKEVDEWRIRKMKTRWGSCNIGCRRIWLNLELAKTPLNCLEYVLVHELTHLHERYHNKRFYHLMDQFLPNWREIKNDLN